MKRVLALVAVVFMVASCMITPAAAWNAESFVNGSVYEYESVADTPMLMSLDDGVSVASETSSSSDTLSWSDIITRLSSSQSIGIPAVVDHPEQTLAGITIPAWTEERLYPDVGLDIQCVVASSNSNLYFRTPSLSVPSSLNGGSVDSIGTPALSLDSSTWSNSLVLDFDVSDLDPFSTFSFSGGIDTRSSLVNLSSSSTLALGYPCRLQLLVNDNLQKDISLSSGTYIDFGTFVYSGTSAVSSIQLIISYSIVYAPYVSASVQGNFSFYSSSDLTFDVLRGDSVLDGFNDAAQDKINEHEAYESEWTGSMTENFNALDLSGFTYPDGLVSAFALITGIFNDLWNGMGDYKILYVFPLTLGVVLLLIGRISKFSGRGSTSRSGKGDDSA